MTLQDYIKEETKINNSFNKKYKFCNSTLDRIMVDVSYNSEIDKLWNKFVNIQN
jgi:hypothetical protein